MFALLPLVFLPLCAVLAWAIARRAELVHQQRAEAARLPRSRPYATTLPDALIP